MAPEARSSRLSSFIWQGCSATLQQEGKEQDCIEETNSKVCPCFIVPIPAKEELIPLTYQIIP
jgi:hypothetical protein